MFKKLYELNVRIYFLILSIYLISPNIAYPQESPANPTLAIGIYAPFSEKDPSMGKDILNAMQLAQSKFKPIKFNYIFFTLNPSNSPDEKNRLQKFILDNKISALVSENSRGGLLASELARENKIIHFSIASDPKIADGEVNFLTWSPAYEQAAVMFNELKKLNINTLGIIRVQHPWADVITTDLMKQIKSKSQIKIILDEQFKLGTENFDPLINKLKTAKPDIYFIMTLPADIQKIVDKMRIAGIDTPVTAIIGTLTPSLEKTLAGQWYVNAIDMDPNFVKDFYHAYSRTPLTEAGYAYDVFNIVAKSFASSKVDSSIPSYKKVSKLIHAQKGTGVMGKFYVEKNGIIFTKSVVKKIKK